MVQSSERITKDLTIRYVAVLAILGGLAIASFLGLARILMDAEGGMVVVNMSGRQRMLVERVAFSANRLALLPVRHQDRADLELRLVEAIDLMESTHIGLLAGLPELKASKPPSPAVKAIYFGPDGDVDRDFHVFIAHARGLAARFPAALSPDDDDLKALIIAAGPLNAGFDRVTTLYQRENEQRLRELFIYHGTALAGTLFLLVVSAAGIFHPMTTRIKADIEERSLAERNLRESEERLWKILDETPVGVSASRRSDGAVAFANARFCEIIGARPEEVLGRPARDHYVDDGQRSRVVAEFKRNQRIDDVEVEFRRRDGSPFWSLLTMRSVRMQGETVNLAWIYDISAIKAAEQRLELLAKVVESASEAVVITNAQNQIEYVNPAFTTITEYESAEVLGRNPKLLRSGRHDAEFYGAMWAELSTTGRWRGEIWNRRKSGEFFAEWLSIVGIKDETGTTTHHIAIFSDITHRKEDEERVWRQANYDALTGLPNRALFMDRLAQAVRQSRRDNKRFALLFIDLDGFKQVNDTLGHAAGDLLLQETATRLSECMRASDTVARLAGDEFTCILQGVRGREDTAMVAAKMLNRLSQPFDLDGRSAEVRGSIGIAHFPDDAEDGPGLLDLADAAMYRVKRRGKNNFVFVSDAAEA